VHRGLVLNAVLSVMVQPISRARVAGGRGSEQGMHHPLSRALGEAVRRGEALAIPSQVSAASSREK